MRFQRNQRVRKNSDFRAAFDFRKSVANGTFVVYARPNGMDQARLGLCVSRRYGNAVARNHWKRRIRETFRTYNDRVPAGYDYVVLPRSNRRPTARDFEPLVQLFHRAAKKVANSADAN